MSYAVGEFGLLHPTPVYGWNVAQLNFLPATVDAAGALITTTSGGGGGTVNQGSAGVDPWLFALPTGASTAARQDTLLAELQLKADLTETQPVSLASVPSHNVTNAGTFAVQAAVSNAFLTEADFDTKVGSLTEVAPATDTASSGLNGRLQRIAQRLTSLIAALGSPFQVGGSIGNTTFAATQATAANLNATVIGTKTHNAGVPAATNVGTLPAIATAAAATYIEGNQVGLSTDLAGNLRISGSISASTTAMPTVADPSYTEGVAANLSQDLGGRLRTLGYAHVSEAPTIYIPDEIRPFSMTSDGRIRVSVSEARVAGPPFNDALRSMWGDLRPWGAAPESPWASW